MTLNQFLKSNKNLFLKVNFSCLDVIATVAQRRWLYSFTHKIAGQESRKKIVVSFVVTTELLKPWMWLLKLGSVKVLKPVFSIFSGRFAFYTMAEVFIKILMDKVTLFIVRFKVLLELKLRNFEKEQRSSVFYIAQWF